ncbi:transcriptional regulator, AsnC family [Marinococcus luteus]|jgi:Lrp/AsnC family transcriptional regulator, leucine-responsive regulatory protein|uniref:Transcriptional regulator, AsnC family n=1 Tax=Marinococcus luteus TaxID=1122204 RepID=A0A1H2WY20_9BACI|nr:Lrp/AsnC family transcriptional regulator [Marinococcus luteus]SDW85437.1 transcriptional regulator, AsnC family [Marinococcus luteus]
MDHIDIEMLEILQEDGRISVSDLSKKLNLSRPSVSERMTRLQERGIIDHFSAVISPEAVGRDTLLMIQVSELKDTISRFEKMIAEDTRVLECHRVTGEVSYFIKAAVQGMDSLRELVDTLISYGNINTSIVLKSPVERRKILPENREQG